MNDIGYIFCFPQYLRHQSLQSKVFGISRDIYSRDILGYLHKKKKHIKPIPAASRLTDLRTYHLRKKNKKQAHQTVHGIFRGFSIFRQTPLFLPSCVAVKILCHPNRLETLNGNERHETFNFVPLVYRMGPPR